MFTILAAAMYLYNVLRERLPIETQHLTYRNTAFNLPPAAPPPPLRQYTETVDTELFAHF